MQTARWLCRRSSDDCEKIDGGTNPSVAASKARLLWPSLSYRCDSVRVVGHILDPKDLPDSAEVYAVSGACIAFRSEAFVDIGGFDENTFLYEEEFIIAERLISGGWNTVLSKRANYGHVEALSSDRIPYRRRLYFIASEQYFLRHYYRWNWLALRLIQGIRYIEWCIYALRWSLTHV